jgi:hypothetical protein
MKLESGKIYADLKEDGTPKLMFRVIRCELCPQHNGYAIESDYNFTGGAEKHNKVQFEKSEVFMMSIGAVSNLKEFTGDIVKFSEDIIENFMENVEDTCELFILPSEFVAAREVIGFDKTSEIVKRYDK